ncbi:hypothetical protein RHMOL_Rhmol05G0117800 [Rhododendron molle]|uniref:Uncharacterized protein n=1 Tax=Rhododendron molle TaxID=49168 RepID=A0ACC0NP79_RHOML|nr:hypothetical protein RHMOL_Rhmol05G0117800 [Rhododendron molle]
MWILDFGSFSLHSSPHRLRFLTISPTATASRQQLQVGSKSKYRKNKMPLGLLLGLGRSWRRKRTSSLDILSSKRGPRDYYKGKNCKPTGFHTRKGWLLTYIIVSKNGVESG